MLLKRAAFFFLGVFWATSLFAQVTKIDPFIREVASDEAPPTGPLSKTLSLSEEGILYVDCFVRVYNSKDAEKVAAKLREKGALVRSVIVDIMTVNLPLNLVEEVASWPEVKYIEGGKPLLPKLSTSRVTINADDVNAGTNLDTRYDGAGTIVGIVDDTRPDWGHADFKDSSDKTRVLFLWDKSASGSGVSEIASSSGLECSNTQIDAGTCTATSGGDTTSHSTHVAGIAAGDDSTFKGIAPGADIIFVFENNAADSVGSLTTGLVDDVRYIFAKASSLGRAAVVNLSLGTSVGAHDDTSSTESALNNLVSGHPGRAIINAAGNERFNSNDSGAATFNGLHAAVDVASGSPEAFEFQVRSGSSLVSLGRKVVVDIWLASTSTCTVELDGFDADKDLIAALDMGAVSAGSSSGDVSDGSGTTLKVDFTDSTNANNGKKHAQATVTFSSAVSASAMQDFFFDLIFRGTCTGDAWLWPDRNGTVSFRKTFSGSFGYTYIAGDSDRTITIPGSASKVIAVGSFMSRGTWTDSSGTSHSQTATSGTDFTSLGATGGTVDDISLFSSLGPTPDGRKKPDITAPGEPIVSSLSSGNSVASGRKVDSTHFKNEGTSMAAPHVAGVVALMFEKNPCLTSDQVKTLITGAAATDSKTGTSLPTNTWGYGKIDALETMKDVTTNTSPCPLTGDGGATTTATEALGGGCVSLTAMTSKKMIFVFFAILSLLGLFRRYLSLRLDRKNPFQ